jgi:hypothetical protein
LAHYVASTSANSIALPMPDGQAREWLAMRGSKKPQLRVLEGSRS